jgi:hypothetical protein
MSDILCLSVIATLRNGVADQATTQGFNVHASIARKTRV